MKAWNKLRRLLAALMLSALLTAFAGAFAYYYQAERALIEQMRADADELVKDVLRHVASSMIESQSAAHALARIPAIQHLLGAGPRAEAREANRVLDNVRDAVGADVCYVIDPRGRVVASSNRGAQDSFVGKNYLFRPYVREALEGRPAMYAAVGVTSGTRGFYYAAPVSGPEEKTILGAAVIKIGVERVESHLTIVHDGIIALTDPDGMIFLANDRDWVLDLLWKAEDAVLRRVAAGMQFGPGPWQERDFVREEGQAARDPSGARFTMHSLELDLLPGWRLLHLHDPRTLAAKISGPWRSASLAMIVALFGVLGAGTLLVFRWARRELDLRGAIEEERERLLVELRAALDNVRTLRGLVPICSICKKVRDGEGYWSQVDAYVSKHTEAEFSHGLCDECLERNYPEYADRATEGQDGPNAAQREEER